MNNYRFVLIQWWMDTLRTSEFTIRALNEHEARAEAAVLARVKQTTFNHTATHFIGKD